MQDLVVMCLLLSLKLKIEKRCLFGGDFNHCGGWFVVGGG